MSRVLSSAEHPAPPEAVPTSSSPPPRNSRHPAAPPRHHLSSAPSEPATCHSCHRPGHLARDCPAWKGRCFACEEAGHIARDCPTHPDRHRPPRLATFASGRPPSSAATYASASRSPGPSPSPQAPSVVPSTTKTSTSPALTIEHVAEMLTAVMAPMNALITELLHRSSERASPSADRGYFVRESERVFPSADHGDIARASERVFPSADLGIMPVNESRGPGPFPPRPTRVVVLPSSRSEVPTCDSATQCCVRPESPRGSPTQFASANCFSPCGRQTDAPSVVSMVSVSSQCSVVSEFSVVLPSPPTEVPTCDSATQCCVRPESPRGSPTQFVSANCFSSCGHQTDVPPLVSMVSVSSQCDITSAARVTALSFVSSDVFFHCETGYRATISHEAELWLDYFKRYQHMYIEFVEAGKKFQLDTATATFLKNHRARTAEADERNAAQTSAMLERMASKENARQAEQARLESLSVPPPAGPEGPGVDCAISREKANVAKKSFASASCASAFPA